MIRLTRAVVTSRPWHAFALFLLGALAIGAAAAAPAYARMAQASVAGTDVANAKPGQQSITIDRTVKLRAVQPGDPTDTPTDDPTRVSRSGPALLNVRGFATIYEATVHLAGGQKTADYTDPETGTVVQNTVLTFRSDACAHLKIVAGRCVAAPLEVMVSESTAKLLRGDVGATMEITVTYSVLTRDGTIYLPASDPQRLSVVGIYQAPDTAGDPYWAGSAFALSNPEQLNGVIAPGTFDAIHPIIQQQRLLAFPRPGALDQDQLAAVRSDVDTSFAKLRNAGLTPASQLPTLLTEIEADQQQAAIGPAVAGIPLVVLCWFVIFLAVAQTAQARRPELALLKLRGTTARDRWWLASAESVLPLIAGAVVGFFAGQLVVRGYGQLSLDHPGPVEVTGRPLAYAGVALVGAILAGLAALRHDLAAPIGDLMRRVTRHAWRWQSTIVISVVVTLAALAVFEARDNTADIPTGLVLLGPALIVLAVGLLLAGLLDPIAERFGRAALRRGRLGIGLAALQIGRPRNSRRVVALLTIAVGLFVFAVTANDVSTRVREDQAQTAIGAPRVLSIDTRDPLTLLTGVRSVDPEGSYAMAAVHLAVQPQTGVPVLLADTSRMAKVAFWPGQDSLADAVHTVRPELADPVIVRGREMLIDVTLTGAYAPPPNTPPSLFLNTISARFTTVNAGVRVLSSEARLRPGTHTYKLEMPCLDGCRLTSLVPRVVINDDATPHVTVSRLRSADGETLVGPEDFGRWLDHTRGLFDVNATSAGLELIGRTEGGGGEPTIQPPDQTDEIPLLATPGANIRSLTTIYGNLFVRQTTVAGSLPAVNQAGGFGDLDLAVRDGLTLGADDAQVWLNDDAPPDIVDRLDKAGLRVVGDHRLADVVEAAGQRPNALGWRFFVLLGMLAVALGVAGMLLVASVERRNRAYALRAMRAQGLSRRAVTLVGLVGYLSLVVCGLLFGAAAALIAWWLDGSYLPIVEGRPLGQGLPGWPSSLTANWWIGAATVFVIVAVIATAALSRLVRRGPRIEFGGGSAL